MKRFSKLLCSFLLMFFVISTACSRSSDEVWNDTKSGGRHVSRGVKTMGGKHGESREVRSNEDFAGAATANEEFISLEDESKEQNLQINDSSLVAQPKETPGELGSAIPGIDQFQDPSQNPALAGIFQNIHFDYNESLVKGDENVSIAQKIATYLKEHPNTYIFVEGHCDNRGPAAYNMALGANRSNTVRSFLVNQGVNPEHIFTVSFGKEHPLVEGDSEEFYRLNRRAQFRLYERNP